MKDPRQGCKPGWRSQSAASRGFGLVELLVCVGLIALLCVLIVPGIQGLLRKAKTAQCVSRMRGLGQGILLYTQDNGEFPHSLHSAAAAGRQPWARAILPYLGHPTPPSDAEWAIIFEKLYRCPADPNENVWLYSYALNVYFELTDGDSYVGSPQTWSKPIAVQHPAHTILLAEPKAVYFADHIMCHLWTSAAGAFNAVDGERHDGRSNYLFVDGHIETLPLPATFDPAKGINLWNPSLAGG